MIISASYRTDIPAFYGEWFMNRVRAGSCAVLNPYSRRAYRVSLRLEDVDGFVFWTRNAGPFLKPLGALHRLGYPFVVQYTITGYPRGLDLSVVDSSRSVRCMGELAGSYGNRVAVWRYDPIVFSSITSAEFHRRNFARLAHQLANTTDEVVVSFAQIYDKTRRNMDRAARRSGFAWDDPDGEAKRELAAELAQIAAAHDMQLTLCSQRQLLVPGALDAKCIDAQRLSDVSGRPNAAPGKGHRPECGCFGSRDIGDYDTCPHGCAYCYAVRSREAALSRYWRHDPRSEFLISPTAPPED